MIPLELSKWQVSSSPFASAVNPFGAPFFYRETTSSTMQDARDIVLRFKEARALPPNGTVALAGNQSSGRGRLPGRSWNSMAGENLLCTILLQGQAAASLALKAGLAAAKAFDSFLAAAGKDCTQIKWPNDVLYNEKKLSGILCEADGECSFIGAGLNIRQKEFPSEISQKASSLALILGNDDEIVPELSVVLERFLSYLKQVLSSDYPWREELSKKLFMLNKEVAFAPGSKQDGAEGTEAVTGILRGIGEDGSLILETKNGNAAFYSGELLVF